MAISKHGLEWSVSKSPYNFEAYDSNLERQMMRRLEFDPYVKKWTKRHGISIPWIDGQKHQRRYHPDFLVEYEDGTRKLIETKDKSKVDTDEVQRKRQSAELWCKRRSMEYVVVTL